jgi:TPR repeat protein
MWYLKAAKQGNASAQVSLARDYWNGDGVTKDKATAMKWFILAATQGDAEAIDTLTELPDVAGSIKVSALTTQAINQWLLEAGALYQQKNYTKAIQIWRSLADSGVPAAQYDLGILYYESNSNGGVLPHDTATGIRLITLAAKGGVPEATVYLKKILDSQLGEAGVFYQKKNYTEAIRIWRSLADWNGTSSGDSDAQYNLGLAYDSGEGVAKDPAQSALWYFRAAKQGDAAAQYNLGVDYLKGDGVTKDSATAIGWITLAAKQGFPEALAALKIIIPVQPAQTAQTSSYRCASTGSTDGSVHCPNAFEVAQLKSQQDWAATHTAQETAEARAQLEVTPDMMNGESREHLAARWQAWNKLRGEIPYTPEENAEIRAKTIRMNAAYDAKHLGRTCNMIGTAEICTDNAPDVDGNQYSVTCVQVSGRGTVCTTRDMRRHIDVSTTISPVYLRKTSGN